MTLYCVSQQRHQLAEGPFWSDKEQALFWVDIIACQVWRWHQPSNQYQSWTLPKKVSAVFCTQSDRLLVCLADGVAYLDRKDGSLQYICSLDEDLEGNRSNDAKCAPDGTLLVGTMDDSVTQAQGRLWHIDAQGNKQLLLDGIGIANTLAWDMTRNRLYFADSLRRQIHAYPWPKWQDVRTENPFIETPVGIEPDGSAIDRQGTIWNAQWDGSCVVGYDPEGQEIERIALPFPRPSSCAFGGVDGRTLFITSASVGLTEAELSDFPLAGHVVAVTLDVGGMPSVPFAGA